jgi:hypothetical protein
MDSGLLLAGLLLLVVLLMVFPQIIVLVGSWVLLPQVVDIGLPILCSCKC